MSEHDEMQTLRDELAAMTAEKEKWRIRCAEETIAWADEATENRRLRRESQGEPSDARAYLDDMNAQGRIKYDDYCNLHDLISEP
ncbi:hypothetical protein AB0300_18820 [Microbacterium sp. NPDC078814]|uniref:hypothetical protein n=1 Tax=Microbacterium sp. NPDC078814 TaxID=3154767 RepID=UPI00344F15EF